MTRIDSLLLPFFQKVKKNNLNLWDTAAFILVATRCFLFGTDAFHSDCFQTKPVWAAVSGHDAPPPHICGARWSYLTCCPIKGTEMYPVTVDVCEQGITHLYVDVM